MAEKIKDIDFVECSAKNNENIKKLFEVAARAAIDKRNGKTPGPPAPFLCCTLL